MQFGRSSERLDAEIARLTPALEDLEPCVERRSAPDDAETSGAPSA
jgi:hypothetical protein